MIALKTGLMASIVMVLKNAKYIKVFTFFFTFLIGKKNIHCFDHISDSQLITKFGTTP